MSCTADQAKPLNLLARAEDETLFRAIRPQPDGPSGELLLIGPLRHQQNPFATNFRKLGQIGSDRIQVAARIDDELHLIYVFRYQLPNHFRPMSLAFVAPM